MFSPRERAFWVAYLTVGLLLFAVPAANAYLDPGTGSLILQAVVGGLMAGGLILRKFWGRITAFLRRGKSAPASTDVR